MGLSTNTILSENFYFCWYASVNNLKAINSFSWIWITEIKKNRIINHNQHLEDIAIPKEGIVVHFRAYGWVEVKRITDDTSWYQAKYSIVKDAIKIYLKSPTIYLDYA